MKTLTRLKLENIIMGAITQRFKLKIPIVFRCVPNFTRIPSFCRFYYRNDRERYGIFTKMFVALGKINQYK